MTTMTTDANPPNPLTPDRVAALLKPFTHVTLLNVDLTDPGKTVHIAGVVDDWCRHTTVQGRAWASLTLRDDSGTREVSVGPDVYERAGGWIAEGALLAFRALVDGSGVFVRLVAERVYDPASEVEDPLAGYGPDNYLYSLASCLMHQGSGNVIAGFVPRTPEDSSPEAVFAATIKALRGELAVQLVQAAQTFRDGRDGVNDAFTALGVTDRWLPTRFFGSLARRLGGVAWPNYTSEQRQRMEQRAARLVERGAGRWLAEQARPAERIDWDTVPREARYALSCATHRSSEYRKRAVMLASYLGTHPVAEIRQDDLDELLAQVNQGLPVPCPFF